MKLYSLFDISLLVLPIAAVVLLVGTLPAVADDSWFGGLESSGVDRATDLAPSAGGQESSTPLSEGDRQSMRDNITNAMLQQASGMRLENDLQIPAQNLIFQQSQQVTVQAVARDPGIPGGGDGGGGRRVFAPGEEGISR